MAEADDGVVLGPAPGGELVKVPFFTGTHGTRCAAIGDPALPRLMAMRALDAGARVRVITSEPEDWFRLRGRAGVSARRLDIVGPGTPPPPDGSRARPWMIMDDTGILAADDTGSHRVSNPWQAFVAISSGRVLTVPALRGLDAIVLYRSSPACRGAALVALRLPDSAVRSLHGIPRDVVAVAGDGMVRLARLRPEPSEAEVA